MRRIIAVLCAFGVVASSAAGAQQAGQRTTSELERLQKGENVDNLPPADSIAPGGRTIPAGTTVNGTVVARGPIVVAGTVNGSVVSLAGGVTVPRGGVVTGDALAVGG
jgi:hypothetical protein